MLSDMVEAGQIVELKVLGDEDGLIKGGQKKTYRTKIFDVLSEDQLEIMMPVEKGVVIPLPVDGQLDLCFYTAKGIYQAYAKIFDRYKSNNVHIMVAELSSNLKKSQRREYYRLDFAMKVRFRELSPREATAAREGYFNPNPMEDTLLEGDVADISGGGMRFTSRTQCTPDTLLFCTYVLPTKAKMRRYNLLARVMRSDESEKRKGVFETRIQYFNMDSDDREEIIKFIFEEERRQRHQASSRK